MFSACVTFNNTESIITKIQHTHTKLRLYANKQTNFPESCQFLLCFLFSGFLYDYSACSGCILTSVHLQRCGMEEVGRWPDSLSLKRNEMYLEMPLASIFSSAETHLNPSHNSLAAASSEASVARFRNLLSATHRFLAVLFSSENMRILLPFRSTLALQAVTFAHLSMAAIRGEWFSCGLFPFLNTWFTLAIPKFSIG